MNANIKNNKKVWLLYFTVIAVTAYLSLFSIIISTLNDDYKFYSEKLEQNKAQSELVIQESKNLSLMTKSELSNLVARIDVLKDEKIFYQGQINSISENAQIVSHLFPLPEYKSFVVTELYQYALMTIPILIFIMLMFFSKQRILRFIPIHFNKNVFSFNMILFFVLFAIVTYIYTLPFDKPISIFEQLGSPNTAIYPYIRCIILYPIMEEIFFRGILYTTLADLFKSLPSKINVILVITIQAVIFASIHGQYKLHYMFMILMFALFLGYIRYKSKNITTCIWMHSAMNALAVLASILVT